MNFKPSTKHNCSYLDDFKSNCSIDKAGGEIPNLAAQCSTYHAEPTPNTSDKVFPSAAAAMVLMDSVAPKKNKAICFKKCVIYLKIQFLKVYRPMEASMYSPATIMIKLSKKPKPTNGRL